MISEISELMQENSKLGKFRIRKWTKTRASKPTTLNLQDFESSRAGYSFDYVNYLYYKYIQLHPKAYIAIFRDRNDMEAANIVSFIIFFGKILYDPDDYERVFKRFKTRNDIFKYISLSMIGLDDAPLLLDSIHEYIPKNKAMSVDMLVTSIINTGKRVRYDNKNTEDFKY
jgi:hypothetical protein